MIVYGNDLQQTPGRRAGVIPFTISNGKFHFLLGIDRATRDFTDFGGSSKPGESLVDTAFREFEEESCGMFGSVADIDTVRESLAIVNTVDKDHPTEAIFFVQVPDTWMINTNDRFLQCQHLFGASRKHNEIIGVRWVAEEAFQKVVFHKTLAVVWTKIQNFLCENTNWTELKVHLLIAADLIKIVKKMWEYIDTSDVSELFL